MSCRNFETVITEMARGQMLEAGSRENTLAHIKACKPCAARFADEQALTGGLRNVASIAQSVDAPARVEATLVSTFRKRPETPVVPVVIPAYRTLSRWATVGIAAAAALLVVSAFGISHLLSINSSDARQHEATIDKPEPAAAIKESGSPAINTSAPSAVDDESKQVVASAPPRASDKQRGLMRNAEFINRPVHSAANYENAPKASEEVTTEFLPLTYGGLSQVDDGLVIRIEVPRSALQSFGLPVNVERAGERVKADVLLGHDGVARAIRFVR